MKLARKFSKTPFFITVFFVLCTVAVMANCADEGPGTLVVRWHVASPEENDPTPCNTAGISQIHIQLTTDPTLPETEWPIFRFACSLGEVNLQLEEGVYTVKIFKESSAGETEVRTLTDVEVLSDSVRDWVGPFPPDPLDAHDINIFWCGNGMREPEGGEECDDGVQNSAVQPDACRLDCKLPFCGDGVADSGESCDGSDLKQTTCADLGLAGDQPGCTDSCEIDESRCLEPIGDLTLNWSIYNSDATALSDCETEGIRYVRYQIRPRLESEILAQGIADCTPAQTVVTDLALDVYTIYLEGLTADLETIAAGFVPTHNHNLVEGTTVDASLVSQTAD